MLPNTVSHSNQRTETKKERDRDRDRERAAKQSKRERERNKGEIIKKTNIAENGQRWEKNRRCRCISLSMTLIEVNLFAS